MYYLPSCVWWAVGGAAFGLFVGFGAAWTIQQQRIDRIVAEHSAERDRMAAEVASARADLATKAEKVVTRYVTQREVVRVESDKVKQEIENAVQIVDAMSDPKCALPERVRDSINAFRRTADIDGAGDAESAMRDAVRTGYGDGRRIGRAGR